MIENIIETKRLFIRPFKLTDIAAFAPICADEEVMRYIGGGAHDRIETEKRMTNWILSYQQDGFGLMALIHKESKHLIGFCGLIRQTVDGEKYIELGYRLAKDYWHQGLATEAASAVKHYAFHSLQLEELISIIDCENLASINVATKVGMTLFRKTKFHNVNVALYKIKNSLY